ncbi:hypothetical protein [Congzhengia minquanensis]|uniref:Uncharacterized protein n=1 Tax=Congzhengia minquanensis TaxID=2763657 RepID=A0A926DNA7_9FIRM|nr:hypothetical protein [Congzhengia minquanensis]MBC8540834.1 hypothetical protein [Congzhengia minquanensis]
MPKRSHKNDKVAKKICPICKKEKPLKSGFYKSSSPLYQADGCVPICTACVKNGIVNEDGTINKNKMKNMCQRLDKPLYWDDLESGYSQYKKEHSFLSDDEIAKKGKEIVALYFKNVMLRQTRNKNFAESEKDGYIHNNSNVTKAEKDRIAKKYMGASAEDIASKEQTTHHPIEEKPIRSDDSEFNVTQDMINLFGEGYTRTEYKHMHRKYNDIKMNYSIQTNLHQEALVTYVRFKVKEELATAKGDVQEAQKWWAAAQDAADKAKLTPKQLTQADLQGGINSFSEIFKAVEQAIDVIPILPQFKFRPNDALDFNIWCYINYARELQGLPQCEYEDVYKFYDKKKQEYIEQYGDPYGIFDDDPTEKNRPSIEKFIVLPKDYKDGDD